MQVTYHLTADDYRHALVAFRNRNLFSRWMILSLVFFLVLVAAIQLRSQKSWMRLTLPATVTGIGLLVFAQWGGPYFSARRQFRKTPSAQEPITLAVQDTGLHFRSPSTDASVAWTHYVKWIEDKRVFALFSSPLIFVIVPKRAFDPDQLVSFKATLCQKIPSVA